MCLPQSSDSPRIYPGICIEPECCAEEGSSDLCVWAVKVLRDGTVVSGDGSGAVTFWDSQHGTRICHFRHPADVLSLAASPDGSTVFAAGRMPRVRMYHRVRQKQGVLNEQLASHKLAGPESAPRVPCLSLYASACCMAALVACPEHRIKPLLHG